MKKRNDIDFVIFPDVIFSDNEIVGTK